MASRIRFSPRPAAALLAAGALMLTAPAAGLASSQTHRSGPTAHVALGLMDSGVRHSPRHHAVKRHRHAARHAATR
jgi:type IV secretory pathway protease TraF